MNKVKGKGIERDNIKRDDGVTAAATTTTIDSTKKSDWQLNG